ncbi:MAG TPA: hypothetical protein VM842_04235, partial [Nitrospira sp.]|nr:hypothetical protein [Nitrospira sp.]
IAQSSGESANTSTGLGIADHSMTSNETVGQQQATERESSGKRTPEKKPDGKAASGAAPKDSGKAPSGKKVPMGSGGGGVTGAVGK